MRIGCIFIGAPREWVQPWENVVREIGEVIVGAIGLIRVGGGNARKWVEKVVSFDPMTTQEQQRPISSDEYKYKDAG